jgi:hypothetical protein
MITFQITKNGKFFYEGECGMYALTLHNNLISMASDKKSVFYKSRFVLKESKNNT